MLRTVLNRSPNLFFASFPCLLEIVDNWKWNYSLLHQIYGALQKMKDFSKVSFRMDHLFRVRRVEYTIIVIFIYFLNTATNLGIHCTWVIVSMLSKSICARQLYSAHFSFITIPTVPILFLIRPHIQTCFCIGCFVYLSWWLLYYYCTVLRDRTPACSPKWAWTVLIKILSGSQRIVSSVFFMSEKYIGH